jgi:glycosyltransferase involved in cell wall biosynthesis
MSLYINHILMSKGQSGVQRYAKNLLLNLDEDLKYDLIKVNFSNKYLLHLYEQTIIPLNLKSTDLLWTPTHISPFFHNNSIITVHDLLPIEKPELFNKSFTFLYKSMLPHLLKNSKHIFSVSEFTKSRIISLYGINEKKITITRNASKFDLNNSYKNSKFLEIIHNFCIENYFLVVGNIGFHKNSFRLLELWKKYFKNVTLIFIGSVPKHLNKKFTSEISDIKNIYHFKNIDDETLANFYINAKASILFSTYEGFGIPLIEANALGCPVVHTNIPSYIEISCDQNYVVNENSDTLFVEIISNLINNNIPIEARNKLIQSSKKFNWSNEGKIVSKVLKNFL